MSLRQERGVRRLGDVLVEHGLITRAQRRAALRAQKRSGGRLGEVLVSRGTLSRDQLNWALGNLLHIPYVQPDPAAIDPALIAAVPLELWRRCQAVPMARVGDELTVAMADPTDLEAIEAIASAAGVPVKAAMANAAAIERAVGALGGGSAARLTQAALLPRGVRLPSRREVLGDPSAVTLVRRHLLDAVRRGADEVIFRPAGDCLVAHTRLRRHAINEASYPIALLGAAIERVRALAGFAAGADAAFQERAVALEIEGCALEVAVSLYQGIQGPRARVRVRPLRQEPRPLGELGFDAQTAARLERAARARAGLIVVCGPERSGCSTTLYALLRAAAAPGLHAVTLERAVRHTWAVATQLEVQDAARYLSTLGALAARPPDLLLAEGLHGREFWTAFGPQTLASTLLLGEMRAADALTALCQLRDCGLTGADLASSLRLIVAQRLVPRPAGRGKARLGLTFELLEPGAEKGTFSFSAQQPSAPKGDTQSGDILLSAPKGGAAGRFAGKQNVPLVSEAIRRAGLHTFAKSVAEP
ncbi:MAG: hypothetical protein FJ290_23770 [Planctomycetes bacterium]|nr:hypothetical protein [Planctomycetota bacterium]